jgi:hypothetical protein
MAENNTGIEQWERDYLRDLAKKQLEIANSEEMRQKEALWYAHNDYETTQPVVTLERGTFNREFEHLWQPKCKTEAARNLEYYFHSNMVQYEYIHDDTVMPKDFAVGIGTWLKPFNIDVKRERTIGETFAYKIDYEIKDLEEEFHKLQKSPMGCNFDGAVKHKEFVEDILGDLMPVRLTFGSSCFLSYYINNIMGLETMMTSMYDCPELFHKMMKMLTDDHIELWDLAEKNGWIRPNNFNTGVAMGTYGFTNHLPKTKDEAAINAGKLTMNDVWGHMNSQETSEISPDMFYEFFFPYYKKVGERFGRLNYGCCESVSAIWEKSLSKFENLSKLSISPWCDEEYIGDMLRGKKIIYHRKPFPNYLAVDKEFDEKAFSEHIEKTLKAARGCFFELSYRDVYSLQGELYRGKKVYETIQKCIDKFWN